MERRKDLGAGGVDDMNEAQKYTFLQRKKIIFYSVFFQTCKRQYFMVLKIIVFKCPSI